MRIIWVLVVLLMVFVSIHGFEDVIITCSEQWLWVRFRWQLLGDVQQPQPSELYLGTRCIANGRLMDYLEYFYPVSRCGIKSEVRAWGILIESSITYEPVNSDVWGFLPISCCVQRAFTLTYWEKVKDNNGHGSEKSTERQNSTSLHVGNSGIHPGGTFRSMVGSHSFDASLLSIKIYLKILDKRQSCQP